MDNLTDDNKLTDEELVFMARGGDEGALEEIFRRYKYDVKRVARSFFLADGGDEDDILQEGSLGLYKAIISYNGSCAFKSYAATCIRTKILNAVKSSNRNKNKPLNGYIPIDEMSNQRLAVAYSVNPEEAYIDKESYFERVSNVKKLLSNMESLVFDLYLEGLSYVEIAQKLGKEPKSIDNALQRIKQKINNLR